MPNQIDALTAMQECIVGECEGLKQLLISKNRRYGNSVANPAGVFAQAPALEQIAVRCDDKLSRIRNMGGLVKVMNDTVHIDEDTLRDLIGYLVLACAVHRLQTTAAKKQPVERSLYNEYDSGPPMRSEDDT